jgi:uncharacterized membrane protein YphA (DoxX/SURF4 family)
VLQRLFSGFPRGWPGIALLLLRAVVGIVLVVQGGFYLKEQNPTLGGWFVGLTALAGGALLVVGFLTPVVGAVAGLLAVGVGLSLLPPCPASLFDTKMPVILTAAILVAIVLLGPGAFSLDCRVFGRREIIIPPPR